MARGRAVLVVLAVLAGLVALPTAAGAQGGGGSITFLNRGELWVMDPADPSGARALAPGMAMTGQTQDDVGRVVAALSDATVVRLDRSGAVLAGPFSPAPSAAELARLDVTPDGEVFTYTAIAPCTDGSGLLCAFVDFARSDGVSPSPVEFVIDDAVSSSFYGDGQVVYDQQGLAELHRLGSGTTQPWFAECAQFPCEDVLHPEIDRGLTRLASIDRQSDDVTFEFFQQVRIHRLQGAPPTPPTLECTIRTPSGPNNFLGSVSWSPDGSALVFDEFLSPEFGVIDPVGIWMVTGIGRGSCADVQSSLTLLAAGDVGVPDWGPAPVAGGTPPPPGPTQPAGSPLIGGERVDGGGDDDPVAQAIATSQRLFGDSSADRVVLATADRFPDALAGAPLAGGDAPILFTAGLGDLDPRVGQEIARVTGGDGVVLILGGVAAVSEAAASQARAAAGDRPCTAPLPASCRFAGTGREDTARLIAEVVVAEHPGDTAFVARGDVFADAITGGAFAAAAGIPILLTPPDSVSPPTREFLQSSGTDSVIVLGGTAAVDAATYDALPGSEKRRIAGAERTETSALVAAELWAPSGLERGGAIVVDVRGDRSWQTALAAAVASARFGMPELGVERPPAGLSPSVQAQADRLAASGPVATFGQVDQVSDAQLSAAGG